MSNEGSPNKWMTFYSTDFRFLPRSCVNESVFEVVEIDSKTVYIMDRKDDWNVYINDVRFKRGPEATIENLIRATSFDVAEPVPK